MQTLGSVAVGSIVKIKENGSPVDFYVAKHDYESGLNGAGRTLVVRKDAHSSLQWAYSGRNAYDNNTLDSWLNSSYKTTLPQYIQTAIGTTKFYYTIGYGNWTVNVLEKAIFILSATELGGTSSSVNVEGTALPISNTLKVVQQGGYFVKQWTRSPQTVNVNNVWTFNTDGNLASEDSAHNSFARPIFTLPGATLYVDDSGNVVTNQPPTAPGTITVPSAGSRGGSLTVSWTASTDPNGNLSGYTLQRMVDSGSWTQVYQGANTSFVDTLPATASAVQYRVQAYDAAGATSDWTTSSSVPVYGTPKLTVPIQAMQGQQVSVSWTEVDGADSYILQRKASTDSDFTQVYAGEALTYSETAGTWTTVQYRVCAVFGSTNGEWATSGSVPVVSASALVVSGSDGDLGTLTSDVQYTVSSDGTNPITVEEDINGTSRTFTAANGGTNVIPVVDLPTGTGTITIKATTQATAGDVTVTRSWTYAKGAPVFSDSGSLAQLTQQGANIFPKTIAEAVRAPGIWGGNLGLALSKLAGAVRYNATQQPKYAEVKIDLATATVGQEINLPYNGQMVPHIVVHIGNPDPELYDASCDGVWMLREDCTEDVAWNSSGVNTLAGSTIMTAMQGYVDGYNETVQASIKSVKIPYCVGNGSATVNSGANGLECKIFPLGGYELGLTSDDNGYLPEDGAKLDYFELGTSSSAKQKRIANLNGTVTLWATRSANVNNSSNVYYISRAGELAGGVTVDPHSIRPVFIMPTTFSATFYVANDGTIMDSQEYVPAGSFEDIQGNAVPVPCIETGSYVGTGTYGQSNPNSLTFGFEPKVLYVQDIFSQSDAYINANVSTDAIFTGTGWIFPNGPRPDTNSPALICITQFGNTVSWYSPNNYNQLNLDGHTYRYIAIGLGGESA